MSVLALSVAAVLAWSGPSAEAAAPPDDLAAYREASARAGRDPAAHVRLALWCESHGLEAERLKHLGIAVLADPTNALARGLLGSLREADSWGTPEAVATRIKRDAEMAASLAEYNRRRESAPDTPHAHWKLASWCERQGLKPEAEAHYTAVTRLDPGRADAWKRLGFVRSRGRWLRPEQVEAEAALHKRQREANSRWQPKLTALRVRLANKGQQADAAHELATVSDPLAVPSVWRVFALSRPEHQKIAVQLLGQVDAPAVSDPLITLAVWARDDEVRRVASETLVRRDPREWLGRLIGRLRTPVEYQVVENQGLGGGKAIRVEGEAFILNRLYTAPRMPEAINRMVAARATGDWSLPLPGRAVPQAIVPMPNLEVAALNRATTDPSNRASSVAGGSTPQGITEERAVTAKAARDADLAFSLATTSLAATSPRRVGGENGRNQARYKQAVAAAEALFEYDLACLESNNVTARQVNDRIFPLLQSSTGQDLGDDRVAWSKWWTEEQGYSFRPPEKVTYFQRAPDTTPNYEPAALSSCFGRGTLVRTIDGPRAIETLRIGDRVLSQDTTSGALSYQPVLVVYHNPPDETRRIEFVGDDAAPIVSTPIHRFWKVGHGWVMARDLLPGDRLRIVGGPAKVAKVTYTEIQPVYNLVVARSHCFFVGPRGALVHDYTLVEPVTTPFDALPSPDTLVSRVE
jgi:hypothetical protein